MAAVSDERSIEYGGDAGDHLPRLHPADLAVLVEAVEALKIQSPWLSAKEAASYLRCPLSRVRKLTVTRDLPHEKDGRRVLYRRDDLDAFIRSGGAISP